MPQPSSPMQHQHWRRGSENELHRAAREGSMKRTLALLARGSIDINEGDPKGWAPLMHGACRGSSRVVEVLLNHGAKVSVVADEGVTALFISSLEGHLSVTMLLVKAGADLEAITYHGYTPLVTAAIEGHFDVMSALIEAGANPNTRLPCDGTTPLYVAASKGHVGLVRMLLRAKASALLPRTKDNDMALLPLDIAAGSGHVDVVCELLQQLGIEGCGGPSAGVRALSTSLSFGRCSPRLVRLLVDAGVETQTTVQVDCKSKSYDSTVLALINLCLRKKKVNGEDATEEQLNRLEGTRRLLMRVEAVHAVTWLWYTHKSRSACTADSKRKSNTVSIPVRTMMPILRRRAARPGVVLATLFRYSVNC